VAIGGALERRVIAPFLVLTLLGIAFVIFWIAWWLVADLFSGTHASAATSKSSDDGRTRSARGERPAISH
jgi:hypothetical protein